MSISKRASSTVALWKHATDQRRASVSGATRPVKFADNGDVHTYPVIVVACVQGQCASGSNNSVMSSGWGWGLGLEEDQTRNDDIYHLHSNQECAHACARAHSCPSSPPFAHVGRRGQPSQPRPVSKNTVAPACSCSHPDAYNSFSLPLCVCFLHSHVHHRLMPRWGGVECHHCMGVLRGPFPATLLVRRG